VLASRPMSDASAPEAWEQRFRAPQTSLPEWSPAAPDRIVYTSNESGVWQVHAWDLTTGERRQVTDHPVGLTDGTPTLDGEGVLWFQDETGDESGRWLVQPFHEGETQPFLEGVPHGWSEGLSQAPGIVAAGISDRDGFAIYVSLAGGAAREIHRSAESVQLGGAEGGGFDRGALSADGTLLCLEHAEHGDLMHPALRVVDPRSGASVSDLLDEGMSLLAKCWSPVTGDRRLAFEHELEGDERPGIWDLATGERTNLTTDLEGGVFVADWWPTARRSCCTTSSRAGRASTGTTSRPACSNRCRASPASSGRHACARTAACGSCTSRGIGGDSSSTTRARSS
jgi:hypothetical protein